ncbi:BTAD domain-containing putative transcriptional regulator [Streptomyces sp. NPDC021608]|uniref:AfsR/SARP family transcriptional regulator n=1 Tax=Streptomyces sp. NPDC021608 TaxID=3154903 RepID=UPI00340BC5AD
MGLEPVRFAVLGDVRVHRGNVVPDLAGPQERAFTALLLVCAGAPIAVSEIVEVLWGADPPRSAVNVVRRHVGSLRRLLEPGLAMRAPGRWLARDAGGYRLAVDAGSLDLLRFRALREEANRVSRRSPERALPLLTEALALWSGPVAAGVPDRIRAHALFAAVDRERLAAVREAADAAARAGMPQAVLAELRQAADRHPLDEPLQSALVLALGAAGRRPEALTVYESVRARLAEELGIDPGAELREARDAVLHVHVSTAPSPDPRRRENPESRETPEGRENRGSREGWENREGRNSRGSRGSWGSWENRAGREGTESAPCPRGAQSPQDPGHAQGPNGPVGPTIPGGLWSPRDPEIREIREIPEIPGGPPGPEDAVVLCDSSVGPGPAAEPEPRPQPVAAAEPAAMPARPVPDQLPQDVPGFTGRQAELDEILRLLDAGGPRPEPTRSDVGPEGSAQAVPAQAGLAHEGAAVAARPGTVVIGAIAGMAGVGKTSLAVHWAHRVADRFPDGRLYVNLRGFDPSGAVMEPGEAVRGFLDALGVAPERVPPGVDAQSALYRSVLAGRKVLVVLDNARDADQVEPLLPGAPGCLALVTSRDALSGLVAAHGAHSLTLRPFDADQARAFLDRRLGAERVAAEPEAADEIGDLCAGLPLALACAAARAAVHPHFALSAVAAELRELHGSLDAFARDDATVDVGTVFSWSSRAVSAQAARLFRLLALHPGPDFTLPAAAALAGLSVRRTRPLLAELTALHLVAEPTPARYSFHDLLRAHAGELVDEQHSGADRQAALDRLHHHYLHTAHAAERLLAPHADPLPPPPAPPGVHPDPLADDGRALAWLTAEHAVLLAVVEAAATSGCSAQERLACQLAWSLEPFFDRRGHWHDGLAVQRTALDAALRSADPVLEARGLGALARIEGRLGLHKRSVARLERALALFTELGDDAGRAHTHRSLGWHREQRGDLPGALRHNQVALDLFRSRGDRAAQAGVLNSVGWYHALLGEYRQALEHCFAALAMLQELGDRYGQAATWDSIAYAHHHLGRHPHALLGYHNALVLLRDLGVPYLEAEILVRVGETHLATGDHEGARVAWRQALGLLRGLGHPDAERVEALLTARDGRAGAG